MRTRLLFVAAICLSMFVGYSSALDASGSNTDSAAEPAQPVVESTPPTAQGGMSIGSKIGVAVKMSLLGVGIEAATPITFHTNVRAGFNAFSYNRGFSNDGVNYAADLSFRSFETHFDWFPFGGGFHLSPGVMVYNGNQIKASAAVPGTQTFSLNSTNYMSDPANPITGSGKIAFNKVGPMFTLGWGNLVPRSNKHIVVPFEMGILFQGSPQATLALAGNACDSTGANCHNIATDSTFQSNVIGQQKKLNSDMSFFQVYPIISLGFGYKF
ncbi:MAG TPA: hypothetical protein VFB28_08520 [Terriglobales bacterium]|nr:hypothetical protein [Terriglobales bacterium]